MPDWSLLFEPSTPVLETIVRGTLMYLAILLLVRFVGQRESGGLSVTDVLLVVLIAEGAAPGLYGEAISVTDSLVLIVTILGWSVIVDALAYRSKVLANIVKARPRPLIENGELNRHLMRRELMTDEEVEAQMRLHGIEDLSLVARAYIEPNGMISVMRREQDENDPPERPPAM
jgi:uncharacterized membrane protein YcaP (DUF421 family)